MKKIASFILIASMCLMFAACGDDKNIAQQNDHQSQPQQPESSPTNVNPPTTARQDPASPVIEEPAVPPSPPSTPTITPIQPETPQVYQVDPSLPTCNELIDPAGSYRGYRVIYANNPTGRIIYPFIAECGDQKYAVWSMNHSERVVSFNQGVFCENPEFLVKNMAGQYYDFSASNPSPENSFPACDSYEPNGVNLFPTTVTPSSCLRVTSYENKCDFFIMQRDGQDQVAFTYQNSPVRTLFWRVF